MNKLGSMLLGFLDFIREPGWPRRISTLVLLIILFNIPYPLYMSGNFEITTLEVSEVRTKTGGILEELLVRSGQEVKKGQVVARLLDIDLQLQRNSMEAHLNEARADLELHERGFRVEEIDSAKAKVGELSAAVRLAEVQLSRNKKLRQSNIISAEQYDESLSLLQQKQQALFQAQEHLRKMKRGFRQEEIAAAQAKVKQLEAQLREMDVHLGWTQVKSPVDGIVITPMKDMQTRLGRSLARGASVMKVVNRDDLVARILVPEHEFSAEELGEQVYLRSYQDPRNVLEGKVTEVEPEIEPGLEELEEYLRATPRTARSEVDVDVDSDVELRVHTRSVPVIAELEVPDEVPLRLKMTGKAKIFCGWRTTGYILGRRLLRSLYVDFWSWY